MKINLASLAKGILKISLLLAVLAAAAAGSYFRWFDNYELELLDARFVLRGPQETTNEVALIEVGDDTAEKLGQWPLDRTYHAMMVKALTKAGASAILFDVLFCERAEHDDRLEEAIAQSGKVYLPIVFDLNKAGGASRIVTAGAVAARTLENLEGKAKGIGHINIIPDSDGKYRRVPLYVQCGGALRPYLSFLVACDYLGVPQEKIRVLPGRYLALGDRMRIPLDDNSCLLINFSGKWATSFRHYSFVDILQSYIASVTGQKPLLDLGVFKDKVCLVGLTATGTTDLHPNPWELLYPALGVHAEIFNSILHKAFVRRVSRETNLCILVLLGVFIAVAVMKTRPVKGLVATLVVLGAFVASAVVVFNRARLWVDIFYPVSALSLLYLSLTFFRYIAERRQRYLLMKELDIARTIQESFLPKVLPETPGLEVASKISAARQVGGDLYYFLDLGEDRLGVMVGDVSGKGVPASLFMAKVTSEFRFLAASGMGPARVLAGLNAKLVQDASGNLFVTVFYLIFDMRTHRVTYSTGGHLPAIRVEQDAAGPEFLNVEEGMPLALMEGEFAERSVPIRPGDVFVLYTDGVTEAVGARRQQYGEERLCALVKANRALSAEQIKEAIWRDVKRFERSAAQHDDITILVIKAG